MKNKSFLLTILILIIFGIVIWLITKHNCECTRGDGECECTRVGYNCGCIDSDTITPPPSVDSPITYNFYVENSGSVRGYFNGASNDACVILKEFYDRIDEKRADKDTITLNYISNYIKQQNVDIGDWLKQIYPNCTESYSDLDTVLVKVLSATNKNTVNLVLSDFCFVSKNGSLPQAKSEITKVFTKGLKEYSDLSIAIYKYEASFDGFYFPGKIAYKGKRPLYLWIFGPSREVKRISNLPIEQNAEAKLFLQPSEIVSHEVIVRNSRMTNKDKTEINVSEWKTDRHENNLYKVDIKGYLSSLILPSSDILDSSKYNVSPKDFYIDNITQNDNDEYTFKVATKRPYPCDLVITYSTEFPTWVDTSNFEQTGLPKDSTTYGIKSLIEGASNAYRNNSNNIFSLKIKLK